jgi:hypothetical protein
MVDGSAEQGGSGRIAALPTSVLWANRIIWCALVAGQIAFAVAVGISLANGGGAGHRMSPTVLTLVGGAILAMGMVLAVVGRFRGVATSGDPRQLRRSAIRGLILPMAVLESAGCFGIGAILVTGSWWPIAVVPGLSLLVQLWLFPKRTVRQR